MKKESEKTVGILTTETTVVLEPQTNGVISEATDVTIIPFENNEHERLLSYEELKHGYADIANRRKLHKTSTPGSYKFFTYASFVFQWLAGIVSMRSKTVLLQHTFTTLEEAGIDKENFVPLVDLWAFDLKKLRVGDLDLSKLKEEKVKEIVIMEDRAPIFFLNFKKYDKNSIVPLNRHGKHKEQWTMGDFKKLVQLLHAHDIKVIIGFWANAANKHKNPFVKNNPDLESVLAPSDDLNPLCFVKAEEGNEMTFAEYIVEQFKKLEKAFGFDGIFLGDGLMGYRVFIDPEAPYDMSHTAYLWTDFYRRISKGIKEIKPGAQLWTYDVMGNGPTRAKKNGVHLPSIIPHVERYFCQTYGAVAWGPSFMNLPGYNSDRDVKEIKELLTVTPENQHHKIWYTGELGDTVELWSNTPDIIKKTHALLNPYSAGVLGVWANEVIRNALE